MIFEWDPKKNKENKAKHGISFDQAKEIWTSDPIQSPSLQFDGEMRHLVVGEVNGTCWTAVITMRGETIRIISVRRARDKERKAYYGS